MLFFLQFSVTSSAFTYNGGDLYTIELPDGYTEYDEGNFKVDDGSAFTIGVEDNTELKYCVSDLNEKKLRESAENMANEAVSAFALVGKEGKMEVVSVKKVKHPNGMDAAVTVFKTSAIINGEEKTHLQKVYEFGGAVNKYTFIFTPDKADDIDALDSAFDSIIINEVEAPGVVDLIIRYSVLGVIVVLLCVGIFKFLRKPKRK